uniref:Oxidized purine nucleoside triphosphate hydrolase n=1 Tax=Plectus sambesii TaxID=2011161 RepID=A0A914UVQ2_9BILA
MTISSIVGNKAKKLFTLAFIRRDNQVLLGLKKRGFGVGKWNGFGGKLNPNETLIDAAQRELEEECGLRSDHLAKMGVLYFEFEDNPVLMEVHVFQTSDFTGEVKESEEMKPQWYDLRDVPFSRMWPDDVFWWPYLLEERKFTGYFKYKDQETIVDYVIEETAAL